MAARAERITFPGSGGNELAGRLDLPAGPPRAYALFAHCFTCGKDSHAAARISAELADLGYGVLRFDFTGLGASGGDFANTHLSSNVDDLVAAATWLGDHHRAPALLVGHSLGGAAALLAARRLAEVRAVATIGAPADAEHLTGLLGHEVVSEADAAGTAEVRLGGRAFTVGRGLLDDLRRHGESSNVLASVNALGAALLLLHSPVDDVVGVEHAARLYRAARHPKSFVALDGADHLLSDPADAAFAARMIAAWAERYVDDARRLAPPPAPSAPVVVAETTQGAYLNHVVIGRHRFLADEPERVGGFDAGPSPYDLLGAALGTCTSMTLRMYADRKQLTLDRVTVEVTHDRVHADDAAADAADGSPPDTAPPAQIDRFRRVVHLDGDLDDAARARLLEIADRCPVHRTLERASRIETELA